MNRLNEKIVEILKQHPEGEDFFDALDAMVRGDMDILSQFLVFSGDKIGDPSVKTLILTGKFGIALLDIYGDKLREAFKDVILVEGGIRTGNKPVIYRDTLECARCILFDDSFYSGTTRDKIEIELKRINPSASIEATCVVYDGSPSKQFKVYSMFRYHKY